MTGILTGKGREFIRKPQAWRYACPAPSIIIAPTSLVGAKFLAMRPGVGAIYPF